MKATKGDIREAPIVSFKKSDIFDLYDARPVEEATSAMPFECELGIEGVQGTVTVWSSWDEGALQAIMCKRVYEALKERLGPLRPSVKRFRLADGSIVEGVGRWAGWFSIGKVRAWTAFEVFDSGGNWEFLFGKPMKKAFEVVHRYRDDTAEVSDKFGSLMLENQRGRRWDRREEVPVCVVEEIAEEVDVGTPVDIFSVGGEIFTRKDDPFLKERVEEVLKQVKIGEDLTAGERQEVRALVAEYADCFALSVNEVLPVEGAVHELRVPEGATFSRKIRQRPLTPPQKKYFNAKIEEMLEAGIIEACSAADVKCVSPTTLAQKAHEGEGLSLEELQHQVNDQCVAAGLEPYFPMPERRERDEVAVVREERPQKWRICQNFAEINKVTEIAPMPQGDIRAKQQRLSGHRWISTFDFAAGFYAVVIHVESRPYLAFYVEGRGYFWYVRMPFGIHGAPTRFAEMVAEHFHDMLLEGLIEVFVDDGGTAADEFGEMMGKLRRVLDRVRERKLSLSASKTVLFMTEVVFAGALVGPKGVQPDRSKLTAIVGWKKPNDALELSRFLGLTGWFRDLVKGYAMLEKPLRDLIGGVEMPAKYTRSVYRRVMAGHKLEGRWGQEHDEAFARLKGVLTSEPVLKNPKFDGSNFVVTTDGCADAFGAVLAQRFTTVLPSGKSVTKLHPLAFASKRTSKTERRYKSFLLEFAALKFGLDKFSDVVWGFPVEIETDCQALRDMLMNEKLSATHARWLNGILAHQIVEVRHVPGKVNIVADGLSRAREDREREEGDGSDWTVKEDWEEMTGLVYDMWRIESMAQVEGLLERFEGEPMFVEVIRAITELDVGESDRERRRAKHRAEGYMIEEGKLWKIGGGRLARGRSRVECVTRDEAVVMAEETHKQGGHWGRDAVKLAMMDKVWCPRMDAVVLEAIRGCGTCKNFGTTHIHSLLRPITRRHPFELLAGDYLSMPSGVGGYHTLGVFIDTFSQHMWAFKYKSAGTAKTTISALQTIFQNFVASECFMTDGGSHFDNEAVREFCEEWNTEREVVAAYSPWVNGLVEGGNKILLHVLKRLCAPELGEDECEAMETDDIPRSWPKHLDHAIRLVNQRILPALEFSPKELLLGLPINTERTLVSVSGVEEVKKEDVVKQMAYTAQQRLDGYAAVVKHAVKRKEVFDRRVLAKAPGEVTFRPGQLVQVYRNDLDMTFKTERKLLPKWSAPRRVVSREANSYRLETLDGEDISGRFSARRLREFVPKKGTKLEKEQEEVQARVDEEEKRKEIKERERVRAERTKESGEEDSEEE